LLPDLDSNPQLKEELEDWNVGAEIFKYGVLPLLTNINLHLYFEPKLRNNKASIPNQCPPSFTVVFFNKMFVETILNPLDQYIDGPIPLNKLYMNTMNLSNCVIIIKLCKKFLA